VKYSDLYLNEVTFDLLSIYTYAILDTKDISGVKPVPGHPIRSVNLHCGLINDVVNMS
jgi:hypothetical protein